MDVPQGGHWVKFNRFFGDAMMIHMAIARLRAAKLPLVACGPQWVVDLFEGCADYTAVFPELSRDFSPWQASRVLRRYQPASCISFPKSVRPHLAAFLARVPVRLGCGALEVRLLSTHHAPFEGQDIHFVERYRQVVDKAFPHLPEPPFTPFRPRAEAMEKATRHWQQRGLEPYVVLAPGANSGNKRPSLRALIALGKRIKQAGFSLVILGGKGDDQELGESLKARFPRALDLTGQCNLALSAAWICNAQAMVGGDSGLAHIGGAAGIPTLVFFGPTRPRHSAPMGPHVHVIRKEDLPCLECMAPCPYPVFSPCMDRVPEERVWEAMTALLCSTSHAPATPRTQLIEG